MDSEMDPAQAFMLAAMSNQDAMNAVIERFDSPIQKFYSGATLFLTGGSGFLGKQLVEKLFRSCKIKKIYMLIRVKKGKTIQERLHDILQDPVYEELHRKQPEFIEKIVPLEGDSKEKLLGMSGRDQRTIMEEVDIIIHMAATIRFDEPIRVATLVNVRGTMEALALAKQCCKLKNFTYVSTAYSQATYSRKDKDVLEQFYPCPIPPTAVVQMSESMEEERLNSITPSLIQDWPNTYAFTKALAEEAVRSMGADLPICIVRPSIVLSSYCEPVPGWLDSSTLFGPSGLMFGVVLGVLRVFKAHVTKRLSFVPVDLVNNTIIAAGWDSTQRKGEGTEIPIYNVASIDSCVTWNFIREVLKNVQFTMSSPKALWYCFILETPHSFVFWFLTWILHLIPAYIIDGVDYVLKLKPKDIPTFVSIYRKINKLALLFDHFLSSEWYFRNANTMAMISRMNDADNAVFNCDISSVDPKLFAKLWLLGVRKYLVKDDLKDSLEASRRQKKLMYLNYVVMGLYLYGLMYIAYRFVTLLITLW